MDDVMNRLNAPLVDHGMTAAAFALFGLGAIAWFLTTATGPPSFTPSALSSS
jgi:hypothetical protein